MKVKSYLFVDGPFDKKTANLRLDFQQTLTFRVGIFRGYYKLCKYGQLVWHSLSKHD